MRDQVINGTWVRAAENPDDMRTVGFYVNLRQADGLVARRTERGNRFRIYAVYGMSPNGPGITVPLQLTERTTPKDINRDLDELARIVRGESVAV